MKRYERESKKIVAGMKAWFGDVNKKRTRHTDDGRTVAEQCFDSGVFTASEFVRRITGDEELALAIHECCFWAQKKQEAEQVL